MAIQIDTKFIQTFLNLFGYSVKELKTVLAVDGNKGPYTIRVIKRYQNDKEIVVDGDPGPQTQGEIIKDIQDMFNTKGISKKCIGTNLAVDGKFESVSTKVTNCFQGIVGIAQDGVFYLQTLTGLVSYNSTSTSAKNTTSNGVVTISYAEDRQDTAYTCGPSSLKMALSHYGLNVDEIWIGRKAGTTSTAGTSVENMVNVIKVINSTYGTSFKARSEGFSSWETLKGYLSKGYPVVLRVQSWIHPNGGEHYVLLYGLDITGGKAYLGDPSYGKRTVTLADIRERIRKVSSASIIVISK
jgi:peptidoglycan hydrolase-like protein with peptidoglycan-binding domain